MFFYYSEFIIRSAADFAEYVYRAVNDAVMKRLETEEVESIHGSVRFEIDDWENNPDELIGEEGPCYIEFDYEVDDFTPEEILEHLRKLAWSMDKEEGLLPLVNGEVYRWSTEGIELYHDFAICYTALKYSATFDKNSITVTYSLEEYFMKEWIDGCIRYHRVEPVDFSSVLSILYQDREIPYGWNESEEDCEDSEYY